MQLEVLNHCLVETCPLRHSWTEPGFYRICVKISVPRTRWGDCPARPTCVTSPKDSTGASSLARPKNAVAIWAEAPLATELYRRDRPVAPLNFRNGLSATESPSDCPP